MNYYEHHLGDYYRKAKHLTMLEPEEWLHV